MANCFKFFKRWEKKVKGAGGPFCVALAIILISIGTTCFFDVIAPSLSYPILSANIYFLIVLNLCMHYFYAMTTSPGFLDDPPRDSGNSFLWARKPNSDKGEKKMIRAADWSEKGVKITPASTTKCEKCEKLRPERSHHCSVCNKCVLKYDHHCPWINNCVGLYNERHFVLFLVYVVLATLIIVVFGFQEFVHALIHSLGISYRKWEHIFTEKWFVQAYFLNVVIFCAVAILLINVLCGVTYGETAGETQDNEKYCREAKKRNEEFINSYDCGKWKNLQIFFNIEGGYSILALFLPLRLDPYTDGFSLAKKDGYENYPSFREAKPRETMMTKLYKLFSFN